MPVVLGGITPVMAGLLALCIIAAAILIVEIVAKALDYIHNTNMFGRFAARFSVSAQRAIDFHKGWLEAAARGATSFFTAIPRALHMMVDAIEDSFWRHLAWIRAIVNLRIPELWRFVRVAIDALRGELLGILNRAVNQLWSLIAAVRSAILGALDAGLRSVSNFARALFDAAMRALTQGLTALQGLIRGLHAAAIALINSVWRILSEQIGALGRTLTALIFQTARWAIDQAVNICFDLAKRYANQLLGLFEGVLVAGCAAVLAPAWPRIVDIIDAIAKAIPGSLAGVIPRIGAFPRVFPRSLPAILAAIAAIGAIAIDWVMRCGLPLCRRLGGFGEEIESLQDELLVLEIMEMVQAAVTDPIGSAGDAASIIPGTVSALSGGVLDALELN